MHGGEGASLAQLILASVGRKLGAGGSPGFPLGQRCARFISTQPVLCTAENELLCGEGSTETAGSGTAHTAQCITSHPPGQGTERLTMAPGASKKVWGSVEVALAALCAILLCCGPMLTCCRQGRYTSVARSLAWPCRLQLVENF